MADDNTNPPPDNSTDSGNSTSATESAEQKDVDTKSGNSGSADNTEAVTKALEGVTNTLASLGTMIKEIPAAVASAVNLSDSNSPEAGKTEGKPKEEPPQEKKEESKPRKKHWFYG